MWNKGTIICKYAIMQSLMEAPLFAHTSQALCAGRYPLQSGLGTSDSNLKLMHPKLY